MPGILVERNLVELTKKAIRSRIIDKLKIQKEEDRDRKSEIIQKKLFRAKVFKRAKKVMFYISFGGEVKTKDMIKEAQNLGKIVAVPFCENHRVIRPCRLQRKIRLKKGLHGTHEPAIKRFMRIRDIDLVVVPGIAFDKKGNRLGRGRGCYDYFLQNLPQDTPCIGLAFAFQILPAVPATATDVSVDKVIFA